MTNADCIRRMSDEQLYDFLSEWECGDIDYSITFCDLCKQGGNALNLDCDGCRKHWLQRDAVDVGGLMYWKRNTTFTADTPQTDLVEDSDDLVKDLVEDEFNPYDAECLRCKHLKYRCEFVPTYCKYEPKDTPQTEYDKYREKIRPYDPHKNWFEDEPQTDCPWK